LGFLQSNGTPLVVEHEGQRQHEFLLRLDQEQQQFHFEQVSARPILSLLRDFSAPIQVDYTYSTSDLMTLAKADDNAFARSQAMQELSQQTLCARSATEADLQVLITVWEQLLQDKQLSPAYLSRALALPSVRQLLAQQRPMDPHALTQKHRHIEQQLA